MTFPVIPADWRGVPTTVCPSCGSRWILVAVQVDEETYEIAAYGTEAECYSCRARLTVATPVDVTDEQRTMAERARAEGLTE